MAKYTNISKKKRLEWEKKGLVSFDSKDQDTFELDREDERGVGLDVKFGSLLVQSYKTKKIRCNPSRWNIHPKTCTSQAQISK